jgi:hypothetical protein
MISLSTTTVFFKLRTVACESARSTYADRQTGPHPRSQMVTIYSPARH